MSPSPFNDAGRNAAEARLARFLPRAGREYAETRNFDFGPGNHDSVSLLSPYLRHRVILETDVLDRALARHSFQDASKFVEEVFWRAYFKGWFEHHPSVWTDYRRSVDALVTSLNENPDLRDRYEQATQARTGIDCFDAWVDELTHTGYLHNHARMWFASIWVFTLNLPWQLGADFFLRNLVDGDPASNTLGWRWVCGLHTKGKTYLARVSNITSYSNNRFNPRGKLAVEAPPLVETVEHPTQPVPAAQVLQPGVPFGLVISEEDCSPETLLPGALPASIVAIPTAALRSPLPVSRLVREFTLGAVLDAASRTEERFDRPVEHASDCNDALVEWAVRKGLRTVVTSYAPVGPAAEQLGRAKKSLDQRGIKLIQIRRFYDSIAWPHASKGFFKLKAQIPRLLERCGIGQPIEEERAAG